MTLVAGWLKGLPKQKRACVIDNLMTITYNLYDIAHPVFVSNFIYIYAYDKSPGATLNSIYLVIFFNINFYM